MDKIELFVNSKWLKISEILNMDCKIQTIKVKNLDIYEDTLLYKIFQICEYFKIDYNKELQIRQIINLKVTGIKDFKGKADCVCIICNNKFKAIRSNIKICNYTHKCNAIDLYTGEIYEKQIMKWNKVEIINDKTYLYGKTFKDKSSQVSANNMITIYSGKNNIVNLTYEDRSDISRRQKENGTFAFWNYTYEERSKRSKELSVKRLKEGTHNWIWDNLSEEQKERLIENSVKTKKENGTYSKMMYERWQNEEFREKMYNKIMLRMKNTIDFIKNNCENIKFNGKIIDYESFKKYNEIPGVWSLWSCETCLTCGQTVNLNKELQWTLRVLANRNLDELEKENPGCTGRWNLIQKYSNLNYKLICINERDKQTREIIEAIEAINNNALYWLPSITQQSENFNEALIDYIKN